MFLLLLLQGPSCLTSLNCAESKCSTRSKVGLLGSQQPQRQILKITHFCLLLLSAVQLHPNFRLSMGFCPETRTFLCAAVTAKKLGLSCGLPHSLQVAVLAGLKYSTSYEDGVRATIIAGGDNASRNVLVGALLAAQVCCGGKGWSEADCGILICSNMICCFHF